MPLCSYTSGPSGCLSRQDASGSAGGARRRRCLEKALLFLNPKRGVPGDCNLPTAKTSTNPSESLPSSTPPPNHDRTPMRMPRRPASVPFSGSKYFLSRIIRALDSHHPSASSSAVRRRRRSPPPTMPPAAVLSGSFHRDDDDDEESSDGFAPSCSARAEDETQANTRSVDDAGRRLLERARSVVVMRSRTTEKRLRNKFVLERSSAARRDISEDCSGGRSRVSGLVGGRERAYLARRWRRGGPSRSRRSRGSGRHGGGVGSPWSVLKDQRCRWLIWIRLSDEMELQQQVVGYGNEI
jgi:hypothetical protein